jgi:hypothetical protein
VHNVLGGEDAIRSKGWNIGVASWSRSEGVWGGHWTSFHLELWCLIVLTGLPAAVRYRLIARVNERIRGVWRRQKGPPVIEGNTKSRLIEGRRG